MADAPELSVVVVCVRGFDGVRRVVRHLRQQAAAPRIELVVVATRADVLEAARPPELIGLHAIRVVAVGAIDNVDAAAAHGVRVAASPLVALLEDHAYPCAGWAEAVILAHRAGWVAVGPAVLNANPSSWQSRANHCVAYGRWPANGQAGPRKDIARHNSSYTRDVLLGYGARLDGLLAMGNGFHEVLRSDRHPFYFEPRARVRHANVSTLASTVDLRFQKGRHFAATRVARGAWPAARRMGFALAAPVFPFTRLVRERRELFAGHSPASLARALPAAFLALCIDAAGQMVGYAFGPGTSEHRVARFEHDRLRHMTWRDRLALAE